MVDVSPFPRRTAAAACWWDARPDCQAGRLFLLTGSNLGMGMCCLRDSNFSHVLVTKAIQLQTQPR